MEQKSWRTTLWGALGAFGTLAYELRKLIDSDAGTAPDWPLVYLALTTLAGLFAARDTKAGK